MASITNMSYDATYSLATIPVKGPEQPQQYLGENIIIDTEDLYGECQQIELVKFEPVPVYEIPMIPDGCSPLEMEIRALGHSEEWENLPVVDLDKEIEQEKQQRQQSAAQQDIKQPSIKQSAAQQDNKQPSIKQSAAQQDIKQPSIKLTTQFGNRSSTQRSPITASNMLKLKKGEFKYRVVRPNAERDIQKSVAQQDLKQQSKLTYAEAVKKPYVCPPTPGKGQFVRAKHAKTPNKPKTTMTPQWTVKGLARPGLYNTAAVKPLLGSGGSQSPIHKTKSVERCNEIITRVKKTICPDYLNHWSCYKADCKWQHDDMQIEQYLEARQRLAGLKQDLREKRNPKNMACYHQAFSQCTFQNCKYSHDPEKIKFFKEHLPCYHYMNTKQCLRIDCRYSHLEEDAEWYKTISRPCKECGEYWEKDHDCLMNIQRQQQIIVSQGRKTPKTPKEQPLYVKSLAEEVTKKLKRKPREHDSWKAYGRPKVTVHAKTGVNTPEWRVKTKILGEIPASRIEKPSIKQFPRTYETDLNNKEIQTVMEIDDRTVTMGYEHPENIRIKRTQGEVITQRKTGDKIEVLEPKKVPFELNQGQDTPIPKIDPKDPYTRQYKSQVLVEGRKYHCNDLYCTITNPDGYFKMCCSEKLPFRRRIELTVIHVDDQLEQDLRPDHLAGMDVRHRRPQMAHIRMKIIDQIKTHCKSWCCRHRIPIARRIGKSCEAWQTIKYRPDKDSTICGIMWDWKNVDDDFTTERDMTISVELLSQIMTHANLSLTSDKATLLSRLENAAKNVGTIAFDRYYALQSKFISQDTVIAAMVIYRNYVEQNQLLGFQNPVTYDGIVLDTESERLASLEITKLRPDQLSAFVHGVNLTLNSVVLS